MEFNYKNIATTALGIIIFGVLSSSSHLLLNRYRMPVIKITKELGAINFHSEALKQASFGHARLFSSLLWISTMIESDLDHYKGDGNSWMYYRFLTISSLDPRFYQNYLIGGKYLSIIKDDLVGADNIYSKGLDVYPLDYQLNYNAGFNATFEMKDPIKGAQYYAKIVNDQATMTKYPFIIGLYQKLKLKNGDINLHDAYQALNSQLLQLHDQRTIDHIKKSLYAIKAELDLTCLNKELKNANDTCETVDYNGNTYIKKGGEWLAPTPWKKFKLHKRN